MRIWKFSLVFLILSLCVIYSSLYGESEVSQETAAEEVIKTKIEERLKLLKRTILQERSMLRALNEKLSEENEKLSKENNQLKGSLENLRQTNKILIEENSQFMQVLQDIQKENERLTQQINSLESQADSNQQD